MPLSRSYSIKAENAYTIVESEAETLGPHHSQVKLQFPLKPSSFDFDFLPMKHIAPLCTQNNVNISFLQLLSIVPFLSWRYLRSIPSSQQLFFRNIASDQYHFRPTHQLMSCLELQVNLLGCVDLAEKPRNLWYRSERFGGGEIKKHLPYFSFAQKHNLIWSNITTRIFK